MDILKFKRSKSVDIFEFFDNYLKKKKILFLFTRFTKNFLIKELHLKKKKQKKKTDIAGYSLKARKRK